VQEFLDFGQLPTKLTVSYQGPGWRKEPGPGSTDGRSCSRTGSFPRKAFEGLCPEDGRADVQLEITSGASCVAAPNEGVQDKSAPRSYVHPVYGTEFLSVSGASAVLADGPELLQEPRRGQRLAALTNAAAELISSWAAEHNAPIPIAKLSLTAGSMLPAGPTPVSGSKRGGQMMLADCFKKARKDSSIAKLPPEAQIEIVNID